MRKLNFKGRKHAVTATCLLVGMFMLTSAVYANYDDAKGYTNYKNAVKQLAFYEDNFSGEGMVDILIDGKSYAKMEGKMKIDGDNSYVEMTSNTLGDKEKYTTIEVIKNGKRYNYSPATNSYYEYGADYGLRPDMSDTTSKKAIRFMELLGDTMVGDLKNNFVLTSNEDGKKSYSVKVSGSQIPEVVNAGISLMFSAANSNSSLPESWVTYENYDSAFKAFYEEKTGEELTDELHNTTTWDANENIGNINEEFYRKYQDILESKGNEGIVFVKEDGSTEYYKTYEEYMENIDSLETIRERDMIALLGSDPYIDNAVCNFILDEDGNLVSNEMEATMVGVDGNGEKHSITMKIDFTVGDYGNTTVEDFDKEGKINDSNK